MGNKSNKQHWSRKEEDEALDAVGFPTKRRNFSKADVCNGLIAYAWLLGELATGDTPESGGRQAVAEGKRAAGAGTGSPRSRP